MSSRLFSSIPPLLLALIDFINSWTGTTIVVRFISWHSAAPTTTLVVQFHHDRVADVFEHFLLGIKLSFCDGGVSFEPLSSLCYSLLDGLLVGRV